MARSLSAKNPIKDISAAPPTRTHMDADGLIITEKLNPMRVKRKMVHPDGDVVEVGLATGWTIRPTGKGYGLDAFKNNPYGAQLLVEKMEDGFLPFAECPVAKGYVPRREGDKACEGTFSDEKCCPHIDRIMQKRREVHRGQQEAIRQAHMSTDKQLLEITKQTLLANAGAPVPESAKGKGIPRG